MRYIGIMHIEILDQHQKLGIDFDGTLVGHPRSHILQKYIVDHPEKDFHIITFRCGQMERNLRWDLQDSVELTGSGLRLDHFKTIECCPKLIFERREVFDDGREFYGWKAKRCAELGLTILVDDMHGHISPYCHELGIPCLNPDLFPGAVEPETLSDLEEWLTQDRGQYGECKGAPLDELQHKQRLVWYMTHTSRTPSHFWPPPSDFCWIGLIENRDFPALRIKVIETLGAEALAENWMHEPAIALNCHRPIELMIDPDRASEVDTLLERMQHGVYT